MVDTVTLLSVGQKTQWHSLRRLVCVKTLFWNSNAVPVRLGRVPEFLPISRPYFGIYHIIGLFKHLLMHNIHAQLLKYYCNIFMRHFCDPQGVLHAVLCHMTFLIACAPGCCLCHGCHILMTPHSGFMPYNVIPTSAI